LFRFSCFFFQAEDGIRDRNVTGVQTCALPISNQNVPYTPGWPQPFPGTILFEYTGQDFQILEKGVEGSAPAKQIRRRTALSQGRSEERRVGKGCRGGGAAGQ